MFQISVEHALCADGKQAQRVNLKGSATIAYAAQLKNALLESIAAADAVCVDVTAATEIDLTTLQLLCAAHGSATGAGKSFTVDGGGSEIYGKVVGDAGFERHVGCLRDTTNTCIWMGR